MAYADITREERGSRIVSEYRERFADNGIILDPDDSPINVLMDVMAHIADLADEDYTGKAIFHCVSAAKAGLMLEAVDKEPAEPADDESDPRGGGDDG